jgi:hypothetical protein
MNSLVVQALLADTEAWTVVQGPRVRETIKPQVDLSAFAIAAGE